MNPRSTCLLSSNITLPVRVLSSITFSSPLSNTHHIHIHRRKMSTSTFSSSKQSFSLPPDIFNHKLYTQLLDLWFSNLSPKAKNPKPEHVRKWFGAEKDFDDICRTGVGEALEALGVGRVVLPPQDEGEGEKEIADVLMGEVDKYGVMDGGVGTVTTDGKGFDPSHIALALVLLLDQMPRNIFRSNQAVIYNHYDRISRAVSHAIYKRKLDRAEVLRTSPPWRQWFYMPLMHSEDMKDHDMLEEKMQGMRGDIEEESSSKGGEGVKAGEGEEDGEEGPMGYLNHMRDSENMHRSILERFGRYPHRNLVLGREFRGEEKSWLEGGGSTFGTS